MHPTLAAEFPSICCITLPDTGNILVADFCIKEEGWLICCSNWFCCCVASFWQVVCLFGYQTGRAGCLLQQAFCPEESTDPIYMLMWCKLAVLY